MFLLLLLLEVAPLFVLLGAQLFLLLLIHGSGEQQGAALSRHFGIASGPDELAKLRAIPAEQLLQAWEVDPDVIVFSILLEFKPVCRALFSSLKTAIVTAVPESQNLHDRLTNLYAVKSGLEVC